MLMRIVFGRRGELCCCGIRVLWSWPGGGIALDGRLNMTGRLRLLGSGRDWGCRWCFG